MIQLVGRPMRFTDEALKYLQAYHWPGNVRELHNVIEQASWMVKGDLVDVGELRESVRLRSTQPIERERSRDVADKLYGALKDGHLTFWGDIHTRFMHRDMTRDDLRELVRRGLEQAGGNYRAMLPVFGISRQDYKRFLNFLAAHDCAIDFRTFRPSRGTVSASDV